MNFKRFISILLSVAAMLCVGVLSVNAASGVTEIRTAQDFIDFANNVNNKRRTYAGEIVSLEADIDVGNCDPVGNADLGNYSSFNGTFEGNGHTITVNITTDKKSAALFGNISNATIRNLTVTGSVVGYNTYTAGIVASTGNYCTIESCKSNVNVSNRNPVSWYGDCSVGGICGVCFGTFIINCENSGTVNGNSNGMSGYTGGIVGQADTSKIIGCTNNGIVTAPSCANVGGIAGWARNGSVISDCLNSNSVSGKSMVGGIVGDLNGSTIYSSKNGVNGSITGADNFAGGIAGYTTDNVLIYGVTNEGAVTITNDIAGSDAGGIVGAGEKNGRIDHAVNRGTVSATKCAGGILGQFFNGSYTLISCVNYGDVYDPSVYSLGGCQAGILGGGTSVSGAVNVSLCANYGNVSGYNNVFGIAALNGENIRSCISAGRITGTSTYYCGLTTANEDSVFYKPVEFDRTIKALNRLLTEDDKKNGRGWGYDNDNNIVPMLTNGLGTEIFPYSITSADELALIATLVNNGWKGQYPNGGLLYFRLDSDIYDEYDVIRPIGRGTLKTTPSTDCAFDDVFDGNGHTVWLRVRAEEDEYEYAGLFGYTFSACIKNLRVAGGVSGESITGGIVGCAIDTLIYNCQNDANVTGGKYVGGIAGFFGTSGDGMIINCVNRGNITATVDHAAGIVGQVDSYRTRESIDVMTRTLNLGDVVSAGKIHDPSYNSYGNELTSAGALLEFGYIYDKNDENFWVDINDGYFPRGFTFPDYFFPISVLNRIGDFNDLYTLAVRGESVGFAELTPEEGEAYPEAYFHTVYPDYDNAGRMEYWYSYSNGMYYVNEYFENEMSEWFFDFWLEEEGYLEPLDREVTYIIDGKFFSTAEEAQDYLYLNGEDGIESISLGGDITTTRPVKIVGDGKTLTVNLNGHTWTYCGLDNSGVFETDSCGTHLIIIGDSDERIKEIHNTPITAYKPEDGYPGFPTIKVHDKYRCRLFVANTDAQIDITYVRVTGTSTDYNGGAIYVKGVSTMLFDYTVFDNSFATESGGAVYIAGEFSRMAYMYLSNTVFYDCSAYTGGGAIYSKSGLYIESFDNSGFVSCHVTEYGGGAIAFIGDSSDSYNTAKSLFFKGCYCGWSARYNDLLAHPNPDVVGGGAIIIADSHTTVTDCEFENCISDGSGGSIYVISLLSDVRITDSHFKDGAAVENGYAISFGLSGGECSNLAILTTARQKIDTVVNSSSSDKPGWIAVSSLFGKTPVTVSQVSQSGASFYGSMLSGGNIIAIICVALLIASGTVAIIIFKRKKSMVNAADSTSDGSPD
ncbi:MAG: hypothetical protein MJ101_03110 [Clostridia bacterium]|nr:hypothetical protein [Clostridia bacterium]